MSNPSSRHHYLPEAFIRQWAFGSKDIVRGFYWDPWKSQLRYRENGPKAFCWADDLFSAQSPNVKRDIIEKEFFAPLDNAGALIRDKLVSEGPGRLNTEEKRDFARLMMSLVSRRPPWIERLRSKTSEIRSELDRDPQLLEMLWGFEYGFQPSDIYENLTADRFDDMHLELLVRLTNNEEVIDSLLRAKWVVQELGLNASELILSDKPLLLSGNTTKGDFFWMIPLSPKTLFYACSDRSVIQHVQSVRPKQLAHDVNFCSIMQADKYIFSRNMHESGGWLEKRLKQKHAIQDGTSNPS